MADTAHSFLLPTEDREHPYPDSPSDPNKRKGKNISSPCGKRLGRSPRRAETAQKARFPRDSETGRTVPPPRSPRPPTGQHRARGDCFSRLARVRPRQALPSRRRKMRFHRVIILNPVAPCGEKRTRSRLLPSACLSRSTFPCEARAADDTAHPLEKIGIRARECAMAEVWRALPSLAACTFCFAACSPSNVSKSFMLPMPMGT